MMMRLQALGKFGNRRPFPVGKSLYLQQQKVLKMGNSTLLGDFLAEAQEAPELIPEVREQFIISFGVKVAFWW